MGQKRICDRAPARKLYQIEVKVCTQLMKGQVGMPTALIVLMRIYLQEMLP